MDCLERSIIADNTEQIEKGVEQTAETELQKIVDKMSKFYFKLNSTG